MRNKLLSAALIAATTIGALQLATLQLRGQIRPEPNRGGAIDLAAADPKVALSRLHPAPGYEISLFATEKEFPELGKPLALAFDTRGRLWVLTSPTYPHYLPGVRPNDKLIILEDVNRDGRADKSTIFADGLYQPMGFELGDGGVLDADGAIRRLDL